MCYSFNYPKMHNHHQHEEFSVDRNENETVFVWVSDEALHKIMDINKVFPKPPEVEEEMRRQKEENALRAEQEELARVKALAPVLVPPTMNQLMAAQIGFKKIKE